MFDIVSQVAGKPWAIRSEIAAHVQDEVKRNGLSALESLTQRGRFAALRRRAMEDEDYGERPRAARSRVNNQSGVAIIQVTNALTQRGGFDSATCEAFQSTDEINQAVQVALADPKVDSILMEFDSPGGSTGGVVEAWDTIRQGRKSKPIVAHVNGDCASAAYWLASACSEIWITPSGMAGSIGVFMMHVDYSAVLEAEGVKITFISAGEYKVEGNPYEAMSKETLSYLQSIVDDFYGQFTTSVARGRSRNGNTVSVDTVRSEYGKGRMLLAKAALAQGMVDQIGTFDEALRRASRMGIEFRNSATKAETETPDVKAEEPKVEPETPPEPALLPVVTEQFRRRHYH